MQITEIVQSKLGPASCPEALSGAHDFGWFATPGKGGEMIWIVGVSEDRAEAKTIAKRKRTELQWELAKAGLGVSATPVAYSDDQAGRWIVGRSLLVERP